MAKTNMLLTHYYKLDGVKDLKPLKARGLFAKAIMLEDNARKTTPEAEEALELAIEALK